MFPTKPRGQVGIGTVIGFIALVLIATLAANVIVDTAGLLQTQAEAISQDSIDQVSNRLQVESTTGHVSDGPNGNRIIVSTNITVTKAPGSDPIDLRNVTYELTSPQGIERGVVGDDQTEISVLTAENEQQPVLTEQADRYILTVYVEKSGVEIGPRDTFRIAFTTASGAETSLELTAPGAMTGRSYVRL